MINYKSQRNTKLIFDFFLLKTRSNSNYLSMVHIPLLQERAYDYSKYLCDVQFIYRVYSWLVLGPQTYNLFIF